MTEKEVSTCFFFFFFSEVEILPFEANSAISIELKEGDTILDLKKRIEERTIYSVNDQTILRPEENDHLLEVCENNELAQDAGIYSNCLVQVQVKATISLLLLDSYVAHSNLVCPNGTQTLLFFFFFFFFFFVGTKDGVVKKEREFSKEANEKLWEVHKLLRFKLRWAGLGHFFLPKFRGYTSSRIESFIDMLALLSVKFEFFSNKTNEKKKKKKKKRAVFGACGYVFAK
ncbi:hypothetical protein RFI_02673 [Reticulomyxa filosa]|uniref:Ubiquitin-like domain-containing protein n=1 Tax=Reticulomyxa filosa TaxID=46433 RepID=X6P8B9_RETFI|nr:hypothetical protein RFI_02673 [Reticulomyxa filosa]|eukprot:ETO34421.1 hypothetical protein RFI_02673 [Reticulomyxa filosa]